MLYMTHIYPRTIRKYKIIAAHSKAELNELRKEYDGHLDDYTEWFLLMQKRLDELANIVFNKSEEK